MATAVMVVDDSATVRIQAGRALVQAGFEVVEAVDGLDALDKLRQTKDVALIICDVNMPRMSGIEFVETLSKRMPQMPPVVMLTTEGHPQLIKRAKESGVVGWMIKPFKADLLVAAARKLVCA